MKPIDLQYPSLGDRVFEAVRDAIRRKELVPGTLYSVAAISEQMGVSRTPVREALLQLAAHGVVRFEPNRGVRILQVTIEDIEEIYNLRLLLEVPCAYQAAIDIDEAGKQKLQESFQGMESSLTANDEILFQQYDLVFHMVILEAGGNDRIVEAVKVTRAQMHARGLSTTPTRPLSAILEPHRRLFEAIMRHDPEAAATAAQSHLRSTLQILIDQSQEGAEETGYRPGLGAWLERLNLSPKA